MKIGNLTTLPEHLIFENCQSIVLLIFIKYAIRHSFEIFNFKLLVFSVFLLHIIHISPPHRITWPNVIKRLIVMA